MKNHDEDVCETTAVSVEDEDAQLVIKNGIVKETISGKGKRFLAIE